MKSKHEIRDQCRLLISLSNHQSVTLRCESVLTLHVFMLRYCTQDWYLKIYSDSNREAAIQMLVSIVNGCFCTGDELSVAVRALTGLLRTEDKDGNTGSDAVKYRQLWQESFEAWVESYSGDWPCYLDVSGERLMALADLLAVFPESVQRQIVCDRYKSFAMMLLSGGKMASITEQQRDIYSRAILICIKHKVEGFEGKLIRNVCRLIKHFTDGEKSTQSDDLIALEIFARNLLPYLPTTAQSLKDICQSQLETGEFSGYEYSRILEFQVYLIYILGYMDDFKSDIVRKNASIIAGVISAPTCYSALETALVLSSKCDPTIIARNLHTFKKINEQEQRDMVGSDSQTNDYFTQTQTSQSLTGSDFQLKKIINEHAEAIDLLRKEYENETSILKLKHKAEIEELKQRLEKEISREKDDEYQKQLQTLGAEMKKLQIAKNDDAIVLCERKCSEELEDARLEFECTKTELLDRCRRDKEAAEECLQLKIHELNKNIETMKKEMEDESREHKSTIDQLQEINNSQKKVEVELRCKLEEELEKYNHLALELEGVHLVIETINDELAKAKSEATKNQNENVALKNDNLSLNERINVLEEELKSIDNELENEKLRQKEKIKQMDGQLEAQKQKYCEAMDYIKQIEEDLEKHTKAISILQSLSDNTRSRSRRAFGPI